MGRCIGYGIRDTCWLFLCVTFFEKITRKQGQHGLLTRWTPAPLSTLQEDQRSGSGGCSPCKYPASVVCSEQSRHLVLALLVRYASRRAKVPHKQGQHPVLARWTPSRAPAREGTAL